MPKKAGRAANGAGTIAQKKNGSWELRFTVDGQRKSRCYKTFTEAEKARREITAAVDQGKFVDAQKMPLSSWLTIWLDQYCQSIKPGTLVQYRGYVKNHIIPAIGHVRLCNLQPHHVQKMVNELSGHGKGKTEISYKTRKNVHGCLSAALGKAVEIKYIAENPATGCSIPRDNDAQNTREIHPFSADEINSFLEKAKESPYFDIYSFALGTGCRLSEILGLRWSRINFKTAFITIDAQLLLQRKAGDVRKLGQTKNRKARKFKVAPQVLEDLKAVKRRQMEARIKAGAVWDNSLDLVFTDAIGGSLPHSSIEHDFRRICDAISAQGHRFHDLRHTFACEALRHGADVKTLSEALGHYSTAFTLDVYAHVTEEMSANFADIISRAIASR